MSKKLVICLLLAQLTSVSALACEISIPKAENLPASELLASEGFIWVGSPALAAQVPESGHWTGMGPDHNYRDKWWLWREGFDAYQESKPELFVFAKKLDTEAQSFSLPHATTGIYGPSHDRRHRILTLLEFPEPGCWEVNATYQGAELQFVFLVGG